MKKIGHRFSLCLCASVVVTLLKSARSVKSAVSRCFFICIGASGETCHADVGSLLWFGVIHACSAAKISQSNWLLYDRIQLSPDKTFRSQVYAVCSHRRNFDCLF